MIDQDASDIMFIAQGLGSIEEITHSLPIVYGDMESLGIPLTKSPDPSLGASESRKLGTLHGSDIGFDIRNYLIYRLNNF